MEEYPDVTELLIVTDVLITDWSSIAFDFMLTKKPIIYIDTPDPFNGKFWFKAEDRVGKIAKNERELIASIADALTNPKTFMKSYSKKLQSILHKAFTYRDGKSTERVVEIILKLVMKSD